MSALLSSLLSAFTGFPPSGLERKPSRSMRFLEIASSFALASDNCERKKHSHSLISFSFNIKYFSSLKAPKGPTSLKLRRSLQLFCLNRFLNDTRILKTQLRGKYHLLSLSFQITFYILLFQNIVQNSYSLSLNEFTLRNLTEIIKMLQQKN